MQHYKLFDHKTIQYNVNHLVLRLYNIMNYLVICLYNLQYYKLSGHKTIQYYTLLYSLWFVILPVWFRKCASSASNISHVLFLYQYLIFLLLPACINSIKQTKNTWQGCAKIVIYQVKGNYRVNNMLATFTSHRVLWLYTVIHSIILPSLPAPLINF